MSISLRPDLLGRYKDIAGLLIRHGHRDLLAHAGLDSVPFTAEEEAAFEDDAADLASDLEQLGPTYVKLGQLLSTRPDLLPAPYLDALARLQDRCAPFPADEARGIIEAELGTDIRSLFREFDDEPIAAASLGQVHRAVLRSGRPVAVKVQRPHIADQVATDLEAIRELAAFADRRFDAGRRFGFAPMVEEFGRSMVRELDYRREAANLEHLARNLSSFERLVVPLPVDDYTTSRVLTMDWVGGRKISAIAPVGLTDLDGEVLAAELFEAYLQQVLIDGFFHADPHPGNVFVTDDRRLALLDLGMVAQLTPAIQDQMVKLLIALSDGDGAAVADHAVPLGDQLVDFDGAEFQRRVVALVTDHQGTTMADLSAGTAIAELTRIAGESGLRPLPELTMLGKALLNLDEVARTLAPDLDPSAVVRDKAAAIVERRMTRSISPAGLMAAAVEAKEFAEKLPDRIGKVLDRLGEGEVRLEVKGIDEHDFMRGLQKLANRITLGLLIAALIIGAAMMSRVETSTTLLGYPVLAVVSFLLATGGAAALAASILWSDRRDRRRPGAD